MYIQYWLRMNEEFNPTDTSELEIMNLTQDHKYVNHPNNRSLGLEEPKFEDLLVCSSSQLTPVRLQRNTRAESSICNRKLSLNSSTRKVHYPEIVHGNHENPSRRRMMERRTELLSTRTFNEHQNRSTEIQDIEKVSNQKKNQKKNLCDMFEELHIEPHAPRYRRRSLERRSALSTTHHPHFDLVSPPTPPPPPPQRTDIAYSNTRPKTLSQIADQSVRKMQRDSISRQVSDGWDQDQKLRRPISQKLSGGSSNSLNTAASTTDKIYQRVRRNSSLLTQQLISMFNKNEKFEEITSPTAHHTNVLLETLKRNNSHNILNTFKNFEEDS